MTCVATHVCCNRTAPPKPIEEPTSKPISVSGKPCVPSLTPPAELLRALSAALADLHVGWYVFGAQAVLHWGRPRFTEDVDVTVLAGTIDAAELISRLKEAGFERRAEGTPAFVARTRVLPLLHAATGWPLDLVLGGPGLEEDFLQRSVAVEVGPGVQVQMIAAEDLIVTKVLAGRPKDLEDAHGILTAQGARLDANAVRAMLVMLEDALGVSDLLPVFEGLNHR
jgi:hypothetical protein